MSLEEACTTGTKELEPRCLCNVNESTVDDLLFSNEPARIAVDNFRGYSPDRRDSVSMIKLVCLHSWISAYVFNLR